MIGGNGGGGLVSARRLHTWGADVHVITTKTADGYRGTPAHQLDILHRMRVPVSPTIDVDMLPEADLIVDALIGYSLDGNPVGPAARLIHLANDHGAPILSLDVPSGIDATTGEIFHPSIRATATMTLALPKEGLLLPAVRPVVGALYLADIGVPPALYAEPGLQREVEPLFARSDMIRLF